MSGGDDPEAGHDFEADIGRLLPHKGEVYFIYPSKQSIDFCYINGFKFTIHVIHLVLIEWALHNYVECVLLYSEVTFIAKSRCQGLI